MAGIFEERERGYEAKWIHDEELHFKVLSRRNDLLGHWAANVLELSPSEAYDYARAVVDVGVSGKGQDPVFEKLRSDFDTKKVDKTDHAIHRMMEEFFRIAKDELTGSF